MSQIPKILIIAPAWIGDAVMSLALIQTLKQQKPTCKIDVLVVPWCQAIYQSHQDINEVISVDIAHGRLGLGKRWHLGRQLAGNNYDEVYVLPNSWKSALIPFFARIPKRIGYLGEARWGLLTKPLPKPKDIPLLVQRYQSLSGSEASINQPRLSVEDKDVAEAMKKFGLDSATPILVFCPGAEYGSAKRWPADYFAKLSGHYLGKGWQIWIFGSTKDKDIAEEIIHNAPAGIINLAGITSLTQAIHLLSKTTQVVSNDSGLMHIAAALQRPTIALFGSSSPAYTPPLSAQAQIVYEGVECSPCFKRECPLQGDEYLKCLKQITPTHIQNIIDLMVT